LIQLFINSKQGKKKPTVSDAIKELELSSDAAKMNTFYLCVLRANAEAFPWKAGPHISWRKLKGVLRLLPALLKELDIHGRFSMK
jgi:hypothetical protein